MARLVAVLLAVATTWALPQMYGAMLRVNDQDEQLGATDTPDEVENLKGGDDEFVPSLCVSRQGQRLHVQFGLELPSEAPILQSLSTDAEALSGRELVEQLIGEVWVTQSPQLSYTSPPSYGLEFQEPRIVRSTSAGARILIDAEEIKSGSPTLRIGLLSIYPHNERIRLLTQTDYSSVSVTGSDLNVERVSRITSRSKIGIWPCVPPWADLQVREWSYPALEGQSVSLTISDATWPGAAVAAVAPGLWVEADLPIALLAFGALYALLAGLWFRALGSRVISVGVARLLAFLFVSFGLLAGIRAIFFFAIPDPTKGFAISFTDTLVKSALEADTPIVLAVDVLIPSVSLIWLIHCLSLQTGSPESRVRTAAQSSSRGRFPVILTAIAGGAFALVSLAIVDRWEGAGRPTAWAWLIVGVLGAIAGAAATTLCPHNRRWLQAVGGTLVAATIVACSTVAPFAFTSMRREPEEASQVVYAASVTVIVLGACIMLMAVMTSQPDVWRHVALSRVAGVMVLVLCILVVPRMVNFMADPSAEAGPWYVPNFILDVDAFFYVIVAIGIGLKLHALGLAGLSTLGYRRVRQLAAGVILLTAYWWNEAWFYLPVTALMGLAITWFWLVPQEGPQYHHEVHARDSLQWTRLERRFRGLVPAGPNNDLREVQGELQGRRAEARAAGVDPVHYYSAPFSAPVEPSSARLGLKAAAVATLAATPFIVWRAVQLAREGFQYGEVDSWQYPALWRFSELTSVFTEWLIVGYIFGFFQAYLRGRTAWHKAGALLLAVALPQLVFHLLWARADQLGEWLLWMLEACIVLGVVALYVDRLVARAGGLTRAEYIEFRGLTTLVGSSGVIALAMIAAVFAIVEGTATEYVSGVLNLPTSQQGPQGGP